MSLLAMPLLVTNLGCEMLYILEQRLKAQNIPKEKSCKVLHDVAKTMFDRNWVDTSLFVPQEVYTVQSTRKIFDRLAHSSIMRLSESSMDKLFDLMLMGFKYQLTCSTSVKGLLQDRRIKVSLFLQEGIQTPNGRIILPSPISAAVGQVRYYSMSGQVEQQEKLELQSQQVNPEEFFCHPVKLGCNLYDKERPKVVPPQRSGVGLTRSARERSLSINPDLGTSSRVMYAEEVLEQGGKDGKRELGLLASLMRIPEAKTDKFKLNLFGDEASTTSPGTILSYSGSKVTAVSLGYEGKNDSYRTGANGLADVMAQMNVDSSQPAEGEDDLLALMDSVA